jgi:glycerol-3-phosphate dehydrogenase
VRYAETAVDVIARRTRLAFLEYEKTKSAVPKVVDLLATQLQWDEARKRKETLAAYAFLETMK